MPVMWLMIIALISGVAQYVFRPKGVEDRIGGLPFLLCIQRLSILLVRSYLESHLIR